MTVTNFRAAIEEAEKTGKQTATVDLEELKVATRRLADIYGGVDLRQVEVQTEQLRKEYVKLIREVDSIKDLDKLELYNKYVEERGNWEIVERALNEQLNQERRKVNRLNSKLLNRDVAKTKKNYRRWLAASDLIKKLALEIDRIEHGGE